MVSLDLQIRLETMATTIRTETETVIKRILPYLTRRGYDLSADLEFETPAQNPEKYSKGYVDILVTCGKTKPSFLIEAKRSGKTLSSQDHKQALGYGKAHSVPFVVVTNGSVIQCINVANGEPIRWNGKLAEKIPTKEQLKTVLSVLRSKPQQTDVPLSNDQDLPFRPGLPLKQLNALFARCHNAIRKIEKSEEHAFADFSKLLFLKLLEEKADFFSEFELPYSYRFHELAAKSQSESDQVRDAVLRMIKDIREQTPYGEVLESKLYISKPKTFHYIIEELASVSFWDSSLDSKGAAFEYYVRATLKGKKLGQYFTPRNLVRLMSALVGREKITSVLQSGTEMRVLDPACGTGGFLVYLMKDTIEQLNQLLAARKINKRSHEELIKRAMKSTFYGADANPAVACAAKMNMIVAGDGHTNIRGEDSLRNQAKSWSAQAPSADLIMTNPPFGTSESATLEANDRSQFPVPTSKGQYLFLQKMALATRPGGEICTVIDEGVLNTSSGSQLRRWLFAKCRVKCIVRLPDETFRPNKINVKSSLVYLERRELDDADSEDNYFVTFCDVLSLGYSGAGDPIRGFPLEDMLSEIGALELGQLGRGETKGTQWRAFDVASHEILNDSHCRLDLKYWEPETRQKVEALKKQGGRSISDLNKIKTSRGKSPSADLYVDEVDGYALVVKAGSNISKEGMLIEEGDYIEKAVYDELEKVAGVRDGDVLLSSTGDGTLGKCCVYRSARPAVADGHVTIIRVDPSEICPEYLCDYLRCGFGSIQIERLFTGSTGLIELTPDHVDSIIVNQFGNLYDQSSVSDQLRKAEQDQARVVMEATQALYDARSTFLRKVKT